MQPTGPDGCRDGCEDTLRVTAFQSLEAAARSAFLRAVVAVRARGSAGPLPDWAARPHRVLFLRDDRVGDMVVSLEIMRAIAESFPTITLDVLASPRNAALARGLPWIGEVLVNRRDSPRESWRSRGELRRRGYDAAIDGRVFVGSVNMHTTLVMLGSRARWRIGLAGRRNGGIYSVPITVPDLPHWIDYLVALAAPFDVAPESRDWRPRLRVDARAASEAARRWSAQGLPGPKVMVNISAGHRDRCWPEDRWRTLLGHLRDRLPSARLAVLGMPEDQGSAERIAGAIGGSAPSLGLEDAIATVASADLVITPDTAVSHIASAFERPAIALMRKDQERLVPYRVPGRNVFGDDAHRLDALPASRVCSALDDYLDETASDHRTTSEARQ